MSIENLDLLARVYCGISTLCGCATQPPIVPYPSFMTMTVKVKVTACDGINNKYYALAMV